MTKAKARARAKANAAKKARKRKETAERADANVSRDRFGSGSIKGPSANANTANFGPARRGSARSR